MRALGEFRKRLSSTFHRQTLVFVFVVIDAPLIEITGQFQDSCLSMLRGATGRLERGTLLIYGERDGEREGSREGWMIKEPTMSYR